MSMEGHEPGGASLRRFKPYPANKGTGVEWLGAIPADWECLPIKRVASIRYGLAEPPRELIDGLPFIRATNVARGKINERDLMMVDPDDVPWSRDPTLRTDDIIVVRSGAYTGDSAIIPARYNGAIAGYDMVVRAHGVAPRFLAWALLSEYMLRAQIEVESLRAAQPHLNAEELRNVVAILPAHSEQQAIAAFLDLETARIDGRAAKKERLIELLHEKRAALITRAVTKGLDPSVPMKDSGVEWLGQIPAHWEVRRLRDIADSLQTGPFGSQLHAGEYVPEGRPVINPANLRDGRLVPDWDSTVDEHTASRLERHALLAGDILFARRGELGRCGLVASHQEGWICGTGSLRLRLRRDLARPGFVLHSLSSQGVEEWLELQSVGATMLNLNTSIIGRIPVVLPSVTEQEGIVSRIEREVHAIGALVAKVREAIERLKELRIALISAAVTGKIDVRAA